MIPGVCPDCGSARPLPDYLADADARAALAAALDCPAGLARLIVPYLALHAPAGRRIVMGKLARVIRELADLIASGQASHQRDTVTVPAGIWQSALRAVLDQHAAGTVRVPLDGHGYLCSIAVSQALAARSVTARSTAPLHPSHRPFAPGADQGDDAAERADLLSRRKALEKLHAAAPGVAGAALAAQIAQIDARLRALGIQLPPITA